MTDIDPKSLERIKAVIEKIPPQNQPRAAKALEDVKDWVKRQENANGR